jgi:hypothetical protein
MLTSARIAFCASPILIGSLLVACSEKPTPKPPTPPVASPSAPSAPTPATPPASTPAPTESTGAASPAAPAAPAAPVDQSKWKNSTATDDPSKIEVAGLEMPKPASWVWTQPTMQFRTLQYTVPGQGGSTEAAELVVSLFMGNDGGPIEQNVSRWANQFRDAEGKAATPKREDREINGLKVILVELAGAYMAMGATGPKEGTLQLAAIVRAPERTVFIRLNGPEKTVEAERDNWNKLVEGLKQSCD